MKTLPRYTLVLLSTLVYQIAYADTVHPNDVYFNAGPGISSLSFMATGWDSTGTQPIDQPAPKWDQENNRLDISIQAGREASTEIADYFNTWEYKGDGQYGGAIAYDLYVPTMGFRPSKLNFWITGWLSINGDTYAVALGQGSYDGSSNNWWLAGQLTGFQTSNQGAGLPSGGTAGSLVTTDGKYMISVDGNDHTFKVTQLYPYTDWMSHIDDGALLSSLSMPGTHDSATYSMGYESVIYDYEAQGLSLLSQLNLGVRVLDIRLCQGVPAVLYPTAYLCHGSGPTQITLVDALTQVTDFLRVNNKESVVLLLKNENLYNGITPENLGTSVGLAIQTIGAQNFFQNNYIPTLGEVRGKAVIVVRDALNSSNSNLDLGINVAWQKDTTFTSPQSPYAGTIPLAYLPVNFSIQDNYNIAAGPVGWDAKISNAAKLINQTKGSIGQRWFINYLSATDASSVWLVAQGVNSRANDKLTAMDDSTIGGFGSTMIDYLGTSNGTTWNVALNNSDLVSTLIRRNASSNTLSKVSIEASHSEISSSSSAATVSSDSKTSDAYKIKIALRFKGGTFDPVHDLSLISRYHAKIGSYIAEKSIRSGSRIRFVKGKPGRAIFIDPGKEITTLTWFKNGINITIATRGQRRDGVNLINLEPKSGVLSGAIPSRLGIDGLATNVNVTYSGKSKLEMLSNGLSRHTWKIKSVR